MTVDPEEAYKHISVPICLFSATISAAAIVTSYIYPKQRRFPQVVLIWTSICDFLFALFIVVKWSAGPLNEYLTRPKIHTGACTAAIYAEWAMQEGTSILSLLLAYTLYITIVKQYDLHQLRTYYYYRYLLVFWIPTLAIPIVCIFVSPFRPVPGVCRMKSTFGLLFKCVNWIIPIIIQTVVMAKVLKVVCTVTRAVKSHTNVSQPLCAKPVLWICIRYFGTQCAQFFFWLPITLWDLVVLGVIPRSDGLVIFSAFSPGLLAINGILIMINNAALWNSVALRFDTFHTKLNVVLHLQDANYVRKDSISLPK
eukprot:Phypoly_transcript_12641.p1 GENE.Phypoly_transcript_12641~~Phypoly_transcript_12641.p1  ORF type:complete len:311 (+),score=6.23 Phypoly_transcript_12641:127-1059(+)